MNLEPRRVLRAEGAVVFAVALWLFFDFGGPVWLLVVLILLPDLSMLGYMRGPEFGSLVYNLGHTYAFPLVIGAAAFVVDATLAVQIALIWAAHIGADRALGLGLKEPTDFADTHLGRMEGPAMDLLEEER